MIHDSLLFDFQNLVAGIREKAAKAVKYNEGPLDCQPLLETITEETEFEDLPLYKEYLSRFDVEHDLEGFELCYNPKWEEYKSDFPMLLRLVAASFSSTYSFNYDVETGKVILGIAVASDDQSTNEKFESLWLFQVYRLFEVYIEEQLTLAGIREQGEEERTTIDEERSLHHIIYQKKIKMLKDQRDRLLNNKSESEDTLSSLDELMDN